jgi:glycosyltransferase involved in cell wall biosynthesis
MMDAGRVLFVNSTLRIGGVQRDLTTILNGLSGLGLDLHLALLEPDGAFVEQLPGEVTLHDLRSPRAARSFLPLHRLIHRLRPHVVFSSMFRINLVLTMLQPWLPRGTRVMIREVTLLDACLGRGFRRVWLRPLAARAFQRADLVVCQSAFMREELQSSLGLDPAKLRIVFNPIDFSFVNRLAGEGNPFAGQGPGPHVLAVGRLHQVKGFDRLIAAFPALQKSHPSATLWIVGDGPKREALRILAAEHGASAIRLVGAQSNPYRWMRHADLMVVPSRFEGTPNAVLEAIACECPLAVLDHPGGTREIMLRTGQVERVVHDLTCWDDAWFARPSRSVIERARQLFSLDVIVRRYLEAMQLPIEGFTRPLLTNAAA